MTEQRSVPETTHFNQQATLPYNLRVQDFRLAMLDVYDFFADVNQMLISRRLKRFDDLARKSMLSGFLPDFLTASLANHSRSLTQNRFHNGHPDLIVDGAYAGDSVKSGIEGVEIKSTLKRGGAVDTHGAREQWLCVFVYVVDRETEPAFERRPLEFTEIYLAHVEVDDFRRNPRSDLGTRTATLHKDGLAKLRRGWVYLSRH